MAGALRHAAGRGAAGEAREAKAAAEQEARAAQEQAAAARQERDEAVTGARSRAAEAGSRAGQAGQDAAEPPARMTPRLSCSVPAPTVTRRPGSPPGNNPKARHAAAGTPGKAERRRRLHCGSRTRLILRRG